MKTYCLTTKDGVVFYISATSPAKALEVFYNYLNTNGKVYKFRSIELADGIEVLVQPKADL